MVQNFMKIGGENLTRPLVNIATGSINYIEPLNLASNSIHETILFDIFGMNALTLCVVYSLVG